MACCSDRGPTVCQRMYAGFLVNRCCINSTDLPDASGIGSGSTPEACYNNKTKKAARIKPCCDRFACNIKTRACEACVSEGEMGKEEMDYDGCCYTKNEKDRLLIDKFYIFDGAKPCRRLFHLEELNSIRARNFVRTHIIIAKAKGKYNGSSAKARV